MKKLAVYVCTLLLGASLSFAEINIAPARATTGTLVTVKSKRHHRHHRRHRRHSATR